tara:strand:+ start:6381 stop:7304 length:924 start_codon:yes stop_codon:yes gene_type:complete
MMKTLIIGSSGLIGRNLTSQLAEQNESVVCMDLDLGATPDIDGVELVQGDVTNFSEVSQVIGTHEPDRIVHLAYLVGRGALQDLSLSLRVNLIGVDNVFRASVEHNVPRIIWASTLGVYSSIDYDDKLIVTEDSPRPYSPYTAFNTASYYSALKHMNEYQALLYSSREDLDICAIRPSTVFGPGRYTGYPWVGNFVEDAMSGKTTNVPMHPDSTFGLVYVDDVVNLFEKVTMAKKLNFDVYNTGGNLISIAEIVETVNTTLGGNMVPDTSREPTFQFNISHERAHEEFGYDILSFAESIKRHSSLIS